MAMDFEDELDLFFIRKDNNLSNHSPESRSAVPPKKVWNSKQLTDKKTFNCIPLMLKHIQNINKDSIDEAYKVINILSNTVQFKYCMVYGRIMSRGNESKSHNTYILDDGTASLEINIFRRTNDMEMIWKLENELQAVKKDMSTQNKNEIVNSLRNLLFKSKEQIDHSNITPGSTVLLYGKPKYYHERMSLTANSLMVDAKTNCDVEIAFKDYLIDWYRNNCISLTTNFS